MQPTTVFVTGSTGFIGTRLVLELVRRGHTVHALTRGSSNRAGLLHERIKLVTADIADRESLNKGMAGCRQVYHLAAYAKNWAKDAGIFFRHNLDGTQNVFDAARENDVERIVFTSTIVTFGPTRPGETGNEDMPRITQHYYTEYEHSKVLAEKEALKLARAGLPVVIVNPTRVYGPGKMTEGNSVSLMIDQYDSGKLPFLLNNGANIGNYVFVDDLVQGHVLAMERGKIGERYILGGENIALKGFYQLVEEVSGKKHFQMNLPPWAAMLYGIIEKKKAEWFGLYPQITPNWVETFLVDWVYSCAKAVLVLAPVLILASFPASRMPEFLAEYSLNELAGLSPADFAFHAFSYLFFYIGWELYFQGFMQFGLREKLGDWNAILVQTALSCILHIGKPSGEIYSSILGALMWGVVAFRTRSLLACILTHWILGVSLDFFICYTR